MATATRKLFVNLATKTLQISDKNGSPFTLPNFNKYEVLPFEVVLVEPALEAVGLPSFSRVDISNLSLSLSLNDTYDDAAPLAYQNTFSKDETTNTFSGTLSLATSPLNSWLSTTVEKDAYFEVEIQEGSNVIKAYLAVVKVKQSVAQVGATVPSPVDEYYTKAQANAQFLQPISPAGVQHTITSPSGTYVRIIGVTDDGVAVDQILPA